MCLGPAQMELFTLEPLSPPSWSLSFRPQTNTLVRMVAADSNPDDFFLARLGRKNACVGMYECAHVRVCARLYS